MAVVLLATAPAFAGDCWINAKTGEAVQTVPIGVSREELVRLQIEKHPLQAHGASGNNYVKVACPSSPSLHAIALPVPPTPLGPSHRVLDFPTPPAPPPPLFYAGVLAGPDLAGTVTFTSPDDLNMGSTFGLFGGMNTPLQGVSVEANVLHTSRTFTKFPDDGISTTSFMIDGKYTVPVTNSISVYSGVGLGAFAVSEDYATGGTGAGLGYNFLAGANMQLTPVISGTLQLRHEGSFAPIDASNGFAVSVDNTAILVGAQFSLPPPPAPPP